MAGSSIPGNSCCTPCTPRTNNSCLFRLPGECVYYSGSNISSAGINTGDNLNVVINKLITTAGGLLPAVTLAWVVGGTGNFISPPPAGSTTLTNPALLNTNVSVFRNGLVQLPFDPGSGNSFYTKLIASDTLTFSQSLGSGEEIIVQTILS